jgi:hypothetical protein
MKIKMNGLTTVLVYFRTRGGDTDKMLRGAVLAHQTTYLIFITNASPSFLIISLLADFTVT